MHQRTIQDGGTILIFLDHKGQTQIDLSSLSPTPGFTQSSNNPSGFSNDQRLNSLEKSLEILAKSTANTNTILNNFMQTMDQLLTSNTQAILYLEI